MALLKNNSSLLTVPAASFGIYFVIAARSSFPADDLYFFLSAVFALCTVLDGGLPYKIAPGTSGPLALIRACRRVQNNLLLVAPFIGVGIVVLISLSPFAAKSSPLDVFGYATLGLLTSCLKVLTDTARVSSLKSRNRVVTDQLTSAFGLIRFILVLIIAGWVPYLPIFTATLAAELACVVRLNRVNLWAILCVPKYSWRWKLQFEGAYLKANFAYNAAFNIDRLAAFYILAAEPYRALIGFTSLYNMAVLPHKLVENELLFPSTKVARSQFSTTLFPAMLCGAGCAGIIVAQYLLTRKLAIDITGIAFAAAVTWVLITVYYNRLWSIALRDFNIAFLAKVNLVASVLAVIGAALGHVAYEHLIPAGLLAYSAINLLGLFVGREAYRRDFAIYLAAATIGSLVGFGAKTLL